MCFVSLVVFTKPACVAGSMVGRSTGRLVPLYALLDRVGLLDLAFEGQYNFTLRLTRFINSRGT